MYQALYRKWRPRTFEDVAGQQNITATLAKEVEGGNLSHAYLFTGSRGTGKTTCAKIFAKAVNCLNPQKGDPCNACEICKGIDSGAIMDVVELDAASNNGVDNIRDMIEETNFTPVRSKYRVYIIDEVHMLSTQACNAFLKTLEEPPEHVIFILATTDPQKLLPTIRSRCQKFDFKRIGPQDISERLQYIAQQESLTLDGEAASLIARISDGSLRDAVSLLDHCAVTDKNITVKTVSAVAGIADKEFLFVLTDCVKTAQAGKALELVNELHKSYSDMSTLCSEFINHFRSLMLIKTVSSAEMLIACTKTEYERLVKQAEGFTIEEILNTMFLLEETSFNLTKGYNKRTELELAVIRLCSPALNTGGEPVLKRLAALEKAVFEGGAITPCDVAKTYVEVPAHPSMNEKETPCRVEDSQKSEDTPAPPSLFDEDNAQLSLQDTPAEAVVQPEDPSAAQPKVPEEEPFEELAVEPEKPETPGDDTAPESCLPEKGQAVFTLWPDVLRSMYSLNPALWAFIRTASVLIEDDTLFLCAENIEAIESYVKISDHLSILRQAFFTASGKDYTIKFKKEGMATIKTAEDTAKPAIGPFSVNKTADFMADIKARTADD